MDFVNGCMYNLPAYQTLAFAAFHHQMISPVKKRNDNINYQVYVQAFIIPPLNVKFRPCTSDINICTI